jgi:hypothetical protein
MQYRPTAAELLSAIAELLETEVIGAVSGPVQHKVRVAANLARILERESELGAAAADREARLTRRLLGKPDGDTTPAPVLRGELAAALRAGPAPGATDDETWAALMTITKDDLAIAKPGHDSWDGE